MSNLPQTNKSLGQHWLTDTSILQSIVDSAHVKPGDVVVEVGPGPGTLSRELLTQGAKLIAVEFDKQLATDFKKSFPDVEVHNQDILKFDFTKVSAPYKIVANIPYYLTSKLIRVISESNNPPELTVLLIQKEVAERVCARAGDMSLLSVSAQYYWECSLGIEVPARFFTPPPKVDSQVVVLERRQPSLFGDINEKLFFRIVKAGFSNRRKTLLNSLSAGMHKSKDETKELLIKANIIESARPQELSLQNWYEVYRALENI